MALAFDLATDGGTGTGGDTSLSFSHTTTGLNRLLIVGLSLSDDATPSVTYNGVSLTQIVKGSDSSSGKYWLFYLINPASGAHTVAASWSPSVSYRVIAASYTGADQATQLVPSATHTSIWGSGADRTESVTTVADNSWVVGFASAQGSGGASNLVANSPTVSRYANTNRIFLDSNSAKTPPGSVTLSANNPNANLTSGFVAAAIQPPTPLTFSVSDSVSINESISQFEIYYRSVSDSTVVSDTVVSIVFNQYYINVSDSTVVTDTITLVRLNTFAIFANEPVQVLDTSTIFAGAQNFSVSDSTIVSDTPTLLRATTLLASDTVTVSDSVMLSPFTSWVNQTKDSSTWVNQSKD